MTEELPKSTPALNGLYSLLCARVPPDFHTPLECEGALWDQAYAEMQAACLAQGKYMLQAILPGKRKNFLLMGVPVVAKMN